MAAGEVGQRNKLVGCRVFAFLLAIKCQARQVQQQFATLYAAPSHVAMLRCVYAPCGSVHINLMLDAQDKHAHTHSIYRAYLFWQSMSLSLFLPLSLSLSLSQFSLSHFKFRL